MSVHYKPEDAYKPHTNTKKVIKHIYGYVGTDLRFLGLCWNNPDQTVAHYTEIGYDKVFVQ